MRNPYIVGDLVMGRDFYGRENIIETICGRRDRAVHVMGMRRIGKTSLLRQLESQLPGIFLDFQAAVGRADLTRQVQRGLRRLTNNHPYLIQWLCYRLWQPDTSTMLSTGNTLRAITPRDLEPDEHLATRLRMDFDYLSDTERRILHEVYAAGQVTAAQLQADLDLPGLSVFLYGLTQLGYLR